MLKHLRKEPRKTEPIALATQCLGQRRIPTIYDLNQHLAAWRTRRNVDQKEVDWHFTTADVRSKLKHLYPGFVNF